MSSQYITPSKRSAEALAGNPEHREAGVCLTEKMRTFDELPSGRRYSAVGRELSVSEATIYTGTGRWRCTVVSAPNMEFIPVLFIYF